MVKGTQDGVFETSVSNTLPFYRPDSDEEAETDEPPEPESENDGFCYNLKDRGQCITYEECTWDYDTCLDPEDDEVVYVSDEDDDTDDYTEDEDSEETEYTEESETSDYEVVVVDDDEEEEEGEDNGEAPRPKSEWELSDPETNELAKIN